MKNMKYGLILGLSLAFVLPAWAETEGDFSFDVTDEAATITGYSGSDAVLAIPSTLGGYPVVAIASQAFLETANLTDVLFPDSLLSIGDTAFAGCTALTNVQFGPQLLSIGGSAFASTSIREIVIPDSVTNIGYSAVTPCLEQLVIGDGMTELCCMKFGTNLQNVVIGDGVTNITSGAFQSCAQLTNIVFGANVQDIDSGAFSGCTSLTDFVAPPTLKILKNGPFGGCTSLTNIVLNEGLENMDGSVLCGVPIREIYIPSTVTNLGNNPFSGCTALERVDLSAATNIQAIPSSAFSGCSSLSTVEFPVGGALTVIGDSAFSGTAIREIVIPDSVTNIGYSAVTPCLEQLFIGDGITELCCMKFGTNLQNVVIGDGVTNITSGAFEFCPQLTNVVFGANVQHIGESAFTDCTALTDLVFPPSVAQVVNSAFSGCTGLTAVTLPDTVTTLSGSAFSGCTGLRTFDTGNGVTNLGSVFGGCTNLTSVRVGSGVRVIESGAFSGMANLQEVYLSEGVEIIHQSAFQGTGITTLTLPDSVVEVSENAFGGCSNLTEIVWGSGVRQVINGAFSGCVALTNVTLPDHVTSLSGGAFSGCTGLLSVEIGNGVTNDLAGVFSGASNLQSIVLGDAMTAVGGGAFSGCINLENVVFGTNIQSIGSGAFYNTGLTSLEIPDLVTNVENGAFGGCSNLTSLVIGDGLTELCCMKFGTNLQNVVISDSVTNITSGAFQSCHQLTNVVFGANVQHIGESAFTDCTALTDIELPASVERLDNSAFSNCSALTNVDFSLATNLTMIAYGAFGGCSALTDVEMPANLQTLTGSPFSGCTSLTNIVLNDGLIEIGDYALGSLPLTSISIPSSVQSLSASALNGCTNLTSIEVDAATVPSGAFCGLYALESLTFGPNVVEIGSGICGGCYALDEVVIPDQVTAIGSGMFGGCTNISRIVIGDGVTNIPSGAFSGGLCNLTEVVLGENVQDIGGGAFYGATSLATVTIPASVTNLNAAAFSGCSSLQDIQFEGEPLLVLDAENGLILSPDGTVVESFLGGRDAVVIPEGVKEIAAGAGFSYQGVLSSVILPDTLETIPAYAFQSCSALTNVAFGAQLRSIGESAFAGTALREVAIPDSVTDLGAQAFRACGALGHVTFGVSLKVIGQEAFRDCAALLAVCLPDGLEWIGPDCFYGCSALNDLRLGSGVLEIGYGAFNYCTSLVSVCLNEGMTEIANNLFEHCFSLRSVNIPSTVTNIGLRAFGWSGLTNLVLPEGLLSIGSYSFEYCQALNSFALPSTLSTIGDYAFQGSAITNWTWSEALTTWNCSSFDSTLYAERMIVLPGETIPANFVSSGLLSSLSAVEIGGELQRMIELVPEGMTIFVRPGTYSPISTSNKAIRIESIAGPEVTIIDGLGTNRCANLSRIPANYLKMTNLSTVLSGFTLSNGVAEVEQSGNTVYYYGGGVNGGTLENCVIRDCSGGYAGGAVNSFLKNCLICHNESGSDGGGAANCYLMDCHVESNICRSGGGGLEDCEATNCIIEGNQCSQAGGGCSRCTLVDCIIRGNSIPVPLHDGWETGGGGIFQGTAFRCAISNNWVKGDLGYGGGAYYAKLLSCQIVSNYAARNGGGTSHCKVTNSVIALNRAGVSQGAFNLNTEDDIKACFIWGNWAPSGDYSLVAARDSNNVKWNNTGSSFYPGTDPLYANPWEGDFRLLVGSPCINTGDSYYIRENMDMFGNPRRVGNIDLGPVEAPDGVGLDMRRVHVEYDGVGRVTPQAALVEPGGTATFCVAEDNLHPLLGWFIGDRCVGTNETYSWTNVTAHGVLTVHFGPTDVWVDAANGSDDNPGTVLAPKASIQSAIEVAGSNDVIHVRPGIYGAIATCDKLLRIVGEKGMERTIIDGDGGICANFGKTTNSVLSGFTLQNGRGSDHDKGVISYGSLENCRIRDCGGTSAVIYYSHLDDCLITSNRLPGRVVYNGVLCRCIITGNTTTSMSLVSDSSLDNCLVAKNTGDAVDSGTATHCTIVGNTGQGCYRTRLWNTIVWGNGEESYYDVENCRSSCLDSLTYGYECIQADPRFLDAEDGDYRLSWDSPCIDFGNALYTTNSMADVVGQPRIYHEIPDIGAYESSYSNRYVLAVEIEGAGLVDPVSGLTTNGGCVTFHAQETVRPFLGWKLNGEWVGEDLNWTWGPVVQDGGLLTAVFETRELYVDAKEGHDTGNGEVDEPLATLQVAIDLAQPGDVLLVRPGTYAPIATYNKAIRIVALEGPEKTVIDAGEALSRCATLSYTNDLYFLDDIGLLQTNTILEGFTLTEGHPSDYYGGGAKGGTLIGCVLAVNSAYNGGGLAYGNAIACTFLNNTASNYGGGQYYGNATDCLFEGNRAGEWGYGGAVYGAWQVSNSTARQNVSGYGGGGFSYCRMVQGCLIENNHAGFEEGYVGEGGGAYNCDVLENCQILNNVVDASGQDYGYGYGGGVYGGIVNNCIICGNQILAGTNGTAYGGGTYGAPLFGCVVASNEATAGNGAYGGGAASGGVAIDCTFSENTVVGGFYASGGGVVGMDLSLCQIINNTVTGGQSASGGGAYGGYEEVTAVDCIFSGNSVWGQGETAYARGGGAAAMQLYRCQIMGNTAEGEQGALGGGASDGFAQECVFSSNRVSVKELDTYAYGCGGGAYALALSQCAVSNNEADFGGGIYLYGQRAIQCQIIGNSAWKQGGGVYGDGSGWSLGNCIVAGNRAGLGGGICDEAGNASGAYHNTFVLNESEGEGNNGLPDWGENNNLVWGNMVAGTLQVPQREVAVLTNITIDPNGPQIVGYTPTVSSNIFTVEMASDGEGHAWFPSTGGCDWDAALATLTKGYWTRDGVMFVQSSISDPIYDEEGAFTGSYTQRQIVALRTLPAGVPYFAAGGRTATLEDLIAAGECDCAIEDVLAGVEFVTTTLTNVYTNANGVAVYGTMTRTPIYESTPCPMVDPWNGDYRLVAGSAAIDAGTTDLGVTTDLEGNARPQGAGPDLGALEAPGGAGVDVDWRRIVVLTEGSGKTDVDMAMASVGGSVTVTALDCGRPFLGWKTDGEIVSTNRTYTLENVIEHGVLTAVFGAGDIWVDAATGADGNVGSEEAPLATLSAAVLMASNGDTVRVKAGTYSPFSVFDKNIEIRSEEGAEKTVIDARWQGRCATLGDPDGSDARDAASLKGFTLRRGRSAREAAWKGAGAAALQGRLEDCIIENCGVFTNDVAGYLFGDYSVVRNAELVHCILRGCHADLLYSGTCHTNRDTMATGNWVRCLWEGGVNINLTLTGNHVQDWLNGSYMVYHEVLTSGYYANCIVWGNAGTNNGTWWSGGWNCIEGALARGATGDEGPIWTDNPAFVDERIGDFRLSALSPYVDVGCDECVTTTIDLAGNERIAGAKVDLGCYEGRVPTCEISFVLGEGLVQLDNKPQAFRVEQGGDVTPPEVAAVSGWRFEGWTPSLEHVVEDTEFEGVTTPALSDWVVEIHGGRVEADRTWSAGVVHVVTGTVTVASGTTLTIEEGAVVKFAPGAKLLREDGGLVVSQGAVFTHLFDDDVGGDTLDDGVDRTPVYGDYEVQVDVSGQGTDFRYTDPTEENSSAEDDSSSPSEVIWGAGEVHVLPDGYSVPRGMTLYLKAGTIVKIGDGKGIDVKGTLIAEGTLAKPVVFTSIHDDEHGGDTDGDGGWQMPSGGDWHQIKVQGEARFDHCSVLYCSSKMNYGGVEASGGKVVFDNSEIAHTMYECVNAHNGGEFVARNSAFWDSSLGFGYYGGNQVRAYNCVFYGLTTAIRQSNKQLVNCVFSECLQFTDQGGDSSRFEHCVFWNPPGYGVQTAVQVEDDANIWGDPKFVDALNGNFHVMEGSPCMDAGDGSVAPELDMFGNGRVTLSGTAASGVPNENGAIPDIGVHEFSGRYSTGSDVDIAVSDLRILIGSQDEVTAGDSLSLAWRLSSLGTTAYVGSWTDRLKLLDGTGHEVVLGEQLNTGRIESGASKLYSGTFVLPMLMDGVWSIALEANIDRGVLEGANRGNNVFVSTNMVAVANLAVQADGGAFGVKACGETLVRLLGVPSDGGLLGLEASGIGDMQILGTSGDLPTEARTWPVLAGAGEAWMPMSSVPVPDATYLLVKNPGAAKTVTLSLGALETRVTGVSPTTLARSTPAVLSMTGLGLKGMTSAELWKDETVVATATEVAAESDTKAAATFALADVEPGTYSVKVQVAGEAYDVPGTVEVAAVRVGAKLKAWLEMPKAVRDGRVFTGYVCYQNVGDADMVAPLFSVSGRESTTKVSATLTTGLQANRAYVIGASPTEPRNILKAGEKGRTPFYFTLLGSYHIDLQHVIPGSGAAPEAYVNAWWKREKEAAAASAQEEELNAKLTAVLPMLVEALKTAMPEDEQLPKSWTISGTARFGDGAVAADERLSLYYENGVGGILQETTTDAEGAFAFVDLSICTNYAIRGETVTVTNGGAVTLADADVTDIALEVGHLGMVTGMVRKADGGQGLADIMVWVMDGEGHEQQAISDEDGRIEFRGLSFGDIRLGTVAVNGLAAAGLQLTLNETNWLASVELPLSDGVAFAGRLTDEGTGEVVPGVELRLSNIADGAEFLTAMTDENGRFVFDGVPVNSTLSVVMVNDDWVLAEDSIQVTTEGVALEQDLHAKPIAPFYAFPATGPAPMTVGFFLRDKALTNEVASYSWDLDGDGEEDSSEAMPTVRYSEAGIFDVTLTLHYNNGETATYREESCVTTHEPLATVYQPGVVALLEDDGANTDDYVLDSWDGESQTLRLTQNEEVPSLALSNGTVFVFYDEDDCFAWKKATNLTQAGMSWTIQVTDVDSLCDVYQSFEFHNSSVAVRSIQPRAPRQTSSRKGTLLRRDDEEQSQEDDTKGSFEGTKDFNLGAEGSSASLTGSIHVDGDYDVHISLLDLIGSMVFNTTPNYNFNLSGNFEAGGKVVLCNVDEEILNKSFELLKIKAGIIFGYHVAAKGTLQASGNFSVKVDNKAQDVSNLNMTLYAEAELSAYLYLKGYAQLGPLAASGELDLGIKSKVNFEFSGDSSGTSVKVDATAPTSPIKLTWHISGRDAVVNELAKPKLKEYMERWSAKAIQLKREAEDAANDKLGDILGGKLEAGTYVQQALAMQKKLAAKKGQVDELLKEIEKYQDDPGKLAELVTSNPALAESVNKLLGSGNEISKWAQSGMEAVRAELLEIRGNLGKYENRLMADLKTHREELEAMAQESRLAHWSQEQWQQITDLSTLLVGRVRRHKDVAKKMQGKAESIKKTKGYSVDTLEGIRQKAAGVEDSEAAEELLATVQWAQEEAGSTVSHVVGGVKEMANPVVERVADFGDGVQEAVEEGITHSFDEMGVYMMTVQEKRRGLSAPAKGMLVQVQDLDVANAGFPTADLIAAKSLLPNDFDVLSSDAWNTVASEDKMSVGYKLGSGLLPCEWASNGEGMEDDWQLKKGLDPRTARAAEDPDGDGVTNGEEYNGTLKAGEEEGEEPTPQHRARTVSRDVDGENSFAYQPPSKDATNPMSADTDEGGVPDMDELLYGLDPNIKNDDNGLCKTCAVEGKEFHGCTCLQKFGNSYPVKDGHCECGGCPECQPSDDSGNGNSSQSHDPNEIVGPAGFGDVETERYVAPGTELEYYIYFENKADAAAAAQEVWVTLPLDANMDWSTFEAGVVMANNTMDIGLTGLQSGTSQVSMATTAFDMRSSVALDLVNGVATWYLRVVDTNTFDEWPEDPYAGFLPPNTTNYCGEGYVTFKVRAREDLALGDRIAACAEIVFDYNDPIVTDPSWWNLVATNVTVSFGEEGALGEKECILGQELGELPEAEGPEGYLFGGWWTEPDGHGRQVDETTVVGDGMQHLYPLWTLNGSRVTLDANGGTGGTESVTAIFGQAMPVAAAPALSKYTFLGYFDATNGGTQYYDGAMQGVTNWDRVDPEVTLYAQWRGNPTVITLNANGGKAGTAKVTAYYGEAMPAVAKAPYRTGYILLGIYSAKSGGTQYWDGDMQSKRAWNQSKASCTLYAHWKKSTTTKVTFNANGGKLGTKSTTATYGAPMPDATGATRTGYTFLGYYTKKSGGVRYYDGKMKSLRKWSSKAKTYTLYAHWSAKKSTVTIQAHGGTPETITATATYGKAMPKITAPTRKGYNLVGVYNKTSAGTKYWTAAGTSARSWNLTGSAYTFHARWKLKTAAITLNRNGGTGGSAKVTATYGKAMPAATAPKRSGYKFLGYYSAKTGGTQYYDAKMASVRKWSSAASKYTLYAQWVRISTITLNANGGSNGTAKVTATYGKAMPKATAPVRKGYTFLGIYNAKTGGTQYYDESMGSVRNWNGTGTAYTFYAHWARNATITIDANGGSNGTEKVTAVVGKPMPAATAPVREGYDFLGIFNKRAGGTAYWTTEMASVRDWNGTGSSYTFYAQWTLSGLDPETGVAVYNGPLAEAEPDVDGGWSVVDGDETTAWTGDAGAGEWHLLLGFETAKSVGGVEVVGEDLPEEGATFLVSPDGGSADLEAWDGATPATFYELLLNFIATNGIPPTVREIYFAPPSSEP